MAKLINGNGNPAIYAAEDADLIASLTGNVTCISNVGNKYAATEEDATTIRLDDGVIITKEGRRIQLEAGESDTFYIPTGTSGQTNYYIIGYKLVQNADSTQVAEQFVQKMNSSSETITEDTFRNGATEVYVSVYRVTQVGFTIDSVDRLLPELLDSASIKEDIEQINSDLANKQDKSDNNLNTTEKTVVGAINELLGKTQISNLKSISSSYTFANLLSDIQTLGKPIYFTNWYETTNFPFMYGAGIGIRGLDGNNITIIYTSAVSGLCAIYSHSVQIPNGEWNTLNKWGMSIAVSLPSDAQWHSYTAPYDGEMCIRAYSKQHNNGTAAAQIGSAGFYFRLAYDFSAPDGYNDAYNAKVTIIPLKKGKTLYMYAESNVVVTDCRFTY